MLRTIVTIVASSAVTAALLLSTGLHGQPSTGVMPRGHVVSSPQPVPYPPPVDITLPVAAGERAGSVSSSPAVAADGTTYVAWSSTAITYVEGTCPSGTSGYSTHEFILYAFNPDGSTRWTVTFEGYASSSPAIQADGTIILASQQAAIGYDCSPYFTVTARTTLYAINPDGTVKWRASRTGPS